MKHGISLEMVDLHRQEPNRNQRESKYFWDELYTLVSAANFKNIEIPYEPKWDFGGRSGIPRSTRSINIKFRDPQNYLTALNNSGIEKITGVYFDPSFFLNDNLDNYFNAFSHFATEAIDFASSVSASYVTLTPTPCIGELNKIYTKNDNDNWKSFSHDILHKTREILTKLVKYAKNKNIVLCIKNEYWSLLRGKKVIDFLKSFDSNIKLDIDTANLAIANTNPCSIISNYPELIGCVHFTDTAFVDKDAVYRQVMPEFPSNNATQIFRDIGHGNIDFPTIISKLNEINYAGYVIFNCKQTRNIYRALLRTRHYIDAILYKNS